MAKKTYKYGDVIEVENEDEGLKLIIEGITERRQVLRTAAVEMLAQDQELAGDVFDAIHEVYPELKKYHLTYRHKDNKIIVKGRSDSAPI